MLVKALMQFLRMCKHTYHHHVQFLSGAIAIYGGGWNYPILKCPNTPPSFGTVESIFFKPTFFKFSLTFPLHLLFGCPSFFPRTSKFIVTFSVT